MTWTASSQTLRLVVVHCRQVLGKGRQISEGHLLKVLAYHRRFSEGHLLMPSLNGCKAQQLRGQ